MHWSYFKRFRMEIDLTGVELPQPSPPPGFRFVPWSWELVEAHAWVKHASFRHEIDANVFSCFLEFERCLQLMREIASRSGFLPEATWLVAAEDDRGKADYCGTIQGVYLAERRLGAIQNVGVVPSHRGRGLGTALLFQCLRGFQQAGAARAYLEVTAENEGAIRLYKRSGFRITKTVYKVVDAICPR